ncbi:putative transcription initiation factor TFIID subunit 7 [Monocercomonoides exilis]|uniref:putative transcription initiation factor TFIID subunit 7 n=1 Tax=Monocercomonoides exilis TaxID=2049356 RepID=UPI00355AB45A|nr:putative transcription initiation factor TFIID subunit 7 [Monocercomonoides exilis]
MDEEELFLEKQFILRAPPRVAENIRRKIRSAKPGKTGPPFSIKFLENDHQHAEVVIDEETFPATLVNLPCIIESQKTFDQKTFYKTADISQMLIIHEVGEEPLHIFDRNSGITPPTRKIRTKRWRKPLSRITEETKKTQSSNRTVSIELVEDSPELKNGRFIQRKGQKDLIPLESLTPQELDRLGIPSFSQRGFPQPPPPKKEDGSSGSKDEKGTPNMGNMQQPASIASTSFVSPSSLGVSSGLSQMMGRFPSSLTMNSMTTNYFGHSLLIPQRHPSQQPFASGGFSASQWLPRNIAASITGSVPGAAPPPPAAATTPSSAMTPGIPQTPVHFPSTSPQPTSSLAAAANSPSPAISASLSSSAAPNGGVKFLPVFSSATPQLATSMSAPSIKSPASLPSSSSIGMLSSSPPSAGAITPHQMRLAQLAQYNQMGAVGLPLGMGMQSGRGIGGMNGAGHVGIGGMGGWEE